MERFIRFLEPKTIISTVLQNVKIPKHWMNFHRKPIKTIYQPKISEFITKKGKLDINCDKSSKNLKLIVSENNNCNKEDNNDPSIISDYLF